jgi:phytoene/squalene synthetase
VLLLAYKLAMKPPSHSEYAQPAVRSLPQCGCSQRRDASALYGFCREVDDIADGETSRALKLTLLRE